MKTKYGEISYEMFDKYLDLLIDGFYKILCLYEDQSETLYQHIQSFLFELSGSENIVECFNDNPLFIVLLSTTESIGDDVLFGDFDNQSFIKREVFKSISIINKIRQFTLEIGESDE